MIGVIRQWLTARLGQVLGTRDRGSSSAEVALATPLLVMILMLVVLAGRLVSVQMDVDAAASSGARSASIARTDPAARTEAERTALATLAARGVTCTNASVTVTTGGLRPGGSVTVTVECTVPLSDLLLLGVPGSRTVRASATSPVDMWRGTMQSLQPTNLDGSSNPSCPACPGWRL
jgi:Flp pilus assembly protein TadG